MLISTCRTRTLYGALGGAILFLTGACQREPLPKMEQQLVGRWEWQATTADTTPVLTPASTGHRQAIVFDRRGRVCFYEDGSLVRAAAFVVRYERRNRHHPARHLIFYRGYKGSQVYEVAGNSLSLREADGSPFQHRYVRQAASPAVSAAVGSGAAAAKVARPL